MTLSRRSLLALLSNSVGAGAVLYGAHASGKDLPSGISKTAADSDPPFVPDLSGVIPYGYMMQTFSHWEGPLPGGHYYPVTEPCDTQHFRHIAVDKTVIYDGKSFVDLKSEAGRKVLFELSLRSRL